MTNYDNIPQELRELNQWVCARNESKAPQKAFEWGSASSTDPQTWSTYEQAVGVVYLGYYDYAGFVFHNNGYVGIDIDVGFENGMITDETVEIINRFKSYTEKSKSGRGVHIIVKGNLPFTGKNNREGIEIYKDCRYFVMTGNVLVYKDIIENQDAIDWIVEKYFNQDETYDILDKNIPFNKKFYNPVWQGPVGNRIKLRPHYPTIGEGSRNLSLLSLAGSLHTIGYDRWQIYKELTIANKIACDPPLDDREITSICNSIVKYRRD